MDIDIREKNTTWLWLYKTIINATYPRVTGRGGVYAADGGQRGRRSRNAGVLVMDRIGHLDQRLHHEVAAYSNRLQ